MRELEARIHALECENAELERERRHLISRLTAVCQVAELQSMAIKRLKSTLTWLERENPLPVTSANTNDLYGMIEAANEAAGRLEG